MGGSAPGAPAARNAAWTRPWHGISVFTIGRATRYARPAVRPRRVERTEGESAPRPGRFGCAAETACQPGPWAKAARTFKSESRTRMFDNRAFPEGSRRRVIGKGLRTVMRRDQESARDTRAV